MVPVVLKKIHSSNLQREALLREQIESLHLDLGNDVGMRPRNMGQRPMGG